MKKRIMVGGTVMSGKYTYILLETNLRSYSEDPVWGYEYYQAKCRIYMDEVERQRNIIKMRKIRINALYGKISDINWAYDPERRSDFQE